MDDDAPVTPAQTIGPFFHPGLSWLVTASRASAAGSQEWLTVSGRVVDADGQGVADAALEVWQPPGPDERGLAGFQRVYTGTDGRFTFGVRGRADGPPRAHVTVFARGLLGALRTRVYPGCAPTQLASEPELREVPRDRLATLTASCTDETRRQFAWDIRLRGEDETVFFALSDS